MRRLPALPAIDISGIREPEILSGDFFRDATPVAHCDAASIDAINGVYPPPPDSRISGTVVVNGWFAVSIENDALPEAVYVVLTGENGDVTYVRTRNSARPDVSAYLKRPKLARSGYVGRLDTSSLNGN